MVEKGVRRAPPLPVDPLHGHAYLEFTAGTDAARHCRKLRRMHVRLHVAVDRDALKAIGEMFRVRYFIPVDSSWHRLFELAHTPTYRELLVEFLSTFTFHPPRANQSSSQPHAPPPPTEVSFRLTSVWRAVMLAEFAVHSGLYLQDEIARNVYTEGMLCTSIMARGHNREWCTSTDLFFFYCFFVQEAVRTCTRSGDRWSIGQPFMMLKDKSIPHLSV
ncbi:hypothetical protein Hanom_Chr09g00827381 [Helianthus anomalus]